MKAYYDYEDGSFWAIRTEGKDCFTANGSKYRDFYPEYMLKAGSEKEKNRRILPNSAKISCESAEAAEASAAKMAEEKSISALKQDAEFWRIAIEINSYLLFFVPDEYKTKELCTLAVIRNGAALMYVPPQIKDYELCRKAVNNNYHALKYVDDELKTKEMCEAAVKSCGSVLEYVPQKFITEELCRKRD